MGSLTGFFNKYQNIENSIHTEELKKQDTAVIEQEKIEKFVELFHDIKKSIKEVEESMDSREADRKIVLLKRKLNLKYRNIPEKTKKHMLNVLIEQKLLPAVLRKVIDKFNGKLMNVI
nr:hypothetical protein 4 [Elusimicrobiota bacterium]